MDSYKDTAKIVVATAALTTAVVTGAAGRLYDGLRRRPRTTMVAAAASLGVAVGIWAYRRGRKPILLQNPTVQESAVEGSIELPAKLPPSQVYLGYPNKDGNIEIIGSGFRIEAAGSDYLMTAAHNLAFDDDLYLIREGQIILVGKPTAAISVGTDAAAMKIPEATWSRLGSSRAKFAPLSRSGSTYVSIVGTNGKGTTGRLRAEDVLGCVSYEGTTMGGYSGAPYHTGSTVLGMHAYGGRRNGGYSVLYLYHLLKIALRVTDEANMYDNAFFQKLMRNRDPLLQDQVVDDWVIVESQEGYYYRFPKVDYQRYRDSWYEAHHPEVLDEYEEECAQPGSRVVINHPNFQSPAHRRAGEEQGLSQLVEQVGLLRGEIQRLNERSNESQKTLVPVYRPRSRKRKTTAPQTQPPQPSPRASGPTQRGGPVA